MRKLFLGIMLSAALAAATSMGAMAAGNPPAGPPQNSHNCEATLGIGYMNTLGSGRAYGQLVSLNASSGPRVLGTISQSAANCGNNGGQIP